MSDGETLDDVDGIPACTVPVVRRCGFEIESGEKTCVKRGGSLKMVPLSSWSAPTTLDVS